jgi:hypothetical protein
VSAGRATGLLLLAALATACRGAAPVPPVVASPPVPLHVEKVDDLPPDFPRAAVEKPETEDLANLAKGVPRPETAATLRFDVDALPAASWGSPRKGSGFSIRSGMGRDPRLLEYIVTVRSALFAEVLVGGASPFTAFTGGTFGQGSAPKCGPGQHSLTLASWAGFSTRRWSDEGMDVEMGRGDFDPATCNATSRRSLVGRAAAIVPGYVYGLRVEDSRAGDERIDERVVLFLPRGAYASVTGDPNAPMNSANTGPFTRLTFPLEPGHSASATVRVSPVSLELWRTLRRTSRPFWSFRQPTSPRDAVVQLDVAWQADTRVGSVVVSVPTNGDRRPYMGLLEAFGGRKHS